MTNEIASGVNKALIYYTLVYVVKNSLRLKFFHVFFSVLCEKKKLKL